MEQFLTEFKHLGNVLISEFGEEKATTIVQTINGVFHANPELFDKLKDPHNIALFNEAKETMINAKNKKRAAGSLLPLLFKIK